MSSWKVVPGCALNQLRNSDVFWSNACCVMAGRCHCSAELNWACKLGSEVVVVVQSRSVNPSISLSTKAVLRRSEKSQKLSV